MSSIALQVLVGMLVTTFIVDAVLRLRTAMYRARTQVWYAQYSHVRLIEPATNQSVNQSTNEGWLDSGPTKPTNQPTSEER